MTGTRVASLLAASIALGCAKRGVDPGRFIPSPETAKTALAAALEAWKEGKPTGRLGGASPTVQVVDETRQGARLSRFEILGVVPGDGPRTFNVLLETENPQDKRTVRYVVVGIDPLWVFRQEDFDKMAHWEMDMKHDDADEKEPSKKAAPTP